MELAQRVSRVLDLATHHACIAFVLLSRYELSARAIYFRRLVQRGWSLGLVSLGGGNYQPLQNTDIIKNGATTHHGACKWALA